MKQRERKGAAPVIKKKESKPHKQLKNDQKSPCPSSVLKEAIKSPHPSSRKVDHKRRARSAVLEETRSPCRFDDRSRAKSHQETTRSPWKSSERKQLKPSTQKLTRSLCKSSEEKRLRSLKKASKSSSRVNGGKREKSPGQESRELSRRADEKKRSVTLVRKTIKLPRPASRKLGYKTKSPIVRPELKILLNTRESRSSSKKISCSKCKKIFRGKSRLQKHLRLHKATRSPPSPGAEARKSGRMTEGEEKLLIRKLRSLVYSLEPSPRTHSKKASRVITPASPAPACRHTRLRALSAVAKRTLTTGAAAAGAVGLARGKSAVHTPLPVPSAHSLQPQGRYKCPVCSMTFPWLCHLKTHIVTHNIDTFRCRKCNFTTLKPEVMTEHQFTHIQQEPVKCNLCNAKFKSVRFLIRHINTDHGYPSG